MLESSSVSAPSVERHLILLLVVIAGVAVAGVLAILPYRLYQRDIRTAEVNAHRIASIVNAALSRAALEGSNLSDLINRFQGIADAEITLERLEKGEVHPAATSRKGSSNLDGTDLTYVAPPILDRGGNAMIASMYFDLTPMKRSSVRLIIDLVIAIAAGSALFSLAVFYVIRRSLVSPLRVLTASIERLERSSDLIELPGMASRELSDLARALEKIGAAAKT
jgi:methyl-accepting chemotaxis protein